MEKEENLNQENTAAETSNEKVEADKQSEDKQEENKVAEEKIELSPEEKIKELEDKLARTFAEMENQRRRFEKEKDDASVSLRASSLSKINFDLARLSIKFKASFANAKPP